MYTTEHFIADLERPWTSVQAGFEQIDRGKATEYRATDGRKLAADIKTRGRAATQSAGQNRGAMSHALSVRTPTRANWPFSQVRASQLQIEMSDPGGTPSIGGRCA